jgi:hypothetical protein
MPLEVASKIQLEQSQSGFDISGIKNPLSAMLIFGKRFVLLKLYRGAVLAFWLRWLP